MAPHHPALRALLFALAAISVASAQTITGDLIVAPSTSITLGNGTTFTGGNASLGNYSRINWEQTGSLSGKTITFGVGSGINLDTANVSLTLGNTTTASGDLYVYSGYGNVSITNQGVLTHTSSSSGYLYATIFSNSGTITNTAPSTSLFIGSTSTGYNTNNTGNITVNASGATIYLDGNVDNTGGILNAQNGAIMLRGSNTVAHLTGGNVIIGASGHVYLNGTLDNTGTTLTGPSTGIYELYGGSIGNGTISSGALTFTGSGGNLKSVNLNDDLNLPASTNVTFTNGTTFTGGNVTLGTNSRFYWEQVGTLAGKVLTLGNGSAIYLDTAHVALTLGSTTTATGDLNIYSYYGNVSIANQGVLTHTSSSYGNLFATTFANSGTITNSSANTGLQIGYNSTGYTTTNTGNITVNASGAVIYLDGNVDNTGGVLNATNGTLQLRGSNTVAHLTGGNVTIGASGHVYLNGTLDNTGTTLTKPSSGIYELYGGSIGNGTIAAGALTYTNYGGTLGNVALNDDLNLPASTNVTFTNGTTFTGGNVTLGTNSRLYWEQVGTLAGKVLTLGNGSGIYLDTANVALTLGSTTTASGDLNIYTYYGNVSIANQGVLTHTSSSSGSLFAPTFSNSGTITNSAANTALFIGSTSSGYTTTNTGNITVNASGAVIYLDGNVDNTGGVLNAVAGTIELRGTNTTGHLNAGNVTISSTGHVYLSGTLNNSGAILTAPSSGMYELYYGTIGNGTIGPGALSFTSGTGTLDAVTINDDLKMPASSSVRLTNGTTFTGGNVTLGGASTLYWQQSGALDAKNISLANGSQLYLTGGNSSLTLGNTTVMTGNIHVYSDGSTGSTFTNQGTINHSLTGYSGSLYAPSLVNTGTIENTADNTTLYFGTSSTGYAVSNSGTITVNAPGGMIYLSGILDNTGGLLNATNGALYFASATTNAALNAGTTKVGSGGHVYLAGNVTITGTLNAPVLGQYELYGASVIGGTVAAGALTFTNYGGTVSGTTILGNLTVPANSYANFVGGTSLASGAAVDIGSNAGLYWKQQGTLSGNNLTFGNNSYIYLSGANAGLTLDSGTTANGSVQIYSDYYSAGTSLTNQGNITHSSGTGNLYAQTFTNAGNITVTGGTMYLGTSSGNATIANNSGATLTLNGGNVNLQQSPTSPLINEGVIDVRAGTLTTNSRLTNGLTGTVQGSGVVSGTLVVSGGTISPGDGGIGTLTFNYGSLTVNGAATFAVDLGGSSSDRLDFRYSTSNISLGTGLLALSLNLLSAPTANTTYNLISISAGSYAITGTFAGLPNSGDTFSASFGGTSYAFTINYQPSFISLAYNPVVVPEPSTYVLLATGLSALGAGWWRRRAVRRSRRS